MTAREGRALENPETRLSLIGFSKKTCTINVDLIGPFKFARERVNMRCVWRVSGLANFGFAGVQEKHSRSRKSICLSRKGKILQILSVIWGAK